MPAQPSGIAPDATRPSLNRRALVEWYRKNRARSVALFDMLHDDTYYSRPIALRHPIVFYEGHLPAFSFNTVVKRGLGQPSIDPTLEALFARGIDPHESQPGDARTETARARDRWPGRDVVRQFAREVDRQVIEALELAEIDKPDHDLLDRGEAVFCILEHEAMHQETLLYMWHRLAFHQKQRPASYDPIVEGPSARQEWVDIPAGRMTLGADRWREAFTWDNERPARVLDVPQFRIQRHNVTNADFLEFVEAGGYRDERLWRPDDWAWLKTESVTHPLFWEPDGSAWWWRGMFERVPLPAAWPVYTSQAEASAYARWRGFRLPTEAEYHRAAFGSQANDERRYPWGDEPPTSRHGVLDFTSWDPQPAGSHPEGRSAWGVEDLMGNGWEWTGTVFEPFPGFSALPSYPEYSAEFFDGAHFVMKGASPATARELLRPSFRNWFRARYPYVYASFRCVDAGQAREVRS